MREADVPNEGPTKLPRYAWWGTPKRAVKDAAPARSPTGSVTWWAVLGGAERAAAGVRWLTHGSALIIVVWVLASLGFAF